MTRLRVLFAGLLVLSCLGCASKGPSRYMNREFYTLAVLPLTNMVAAEGHAAEVMQPHVERAARARGYRVLKWGLMVKELSAKGLQPSTVGDTEKGQLARWLDVDGVVSVVIHTWGASVTPLGGSKVTVMAEFFIHDREGNLIWRRRQQASRKRHMFKALTNLRPETANKLSVTVCEQAFRRLKLAGFDPDPELRGS